MVAMQLYCLSQMKVELQARPQSKQVRIDKPLTLYSNPQQSQTCFQRGKVEQQANRLKEAIELYGRAAMYDPSNFKALCNAGSCYRALGRLTEARDMYRKAIRQCPSDAISHYNLANSERILGNFDVAIQEYEFVVKHGGGLVLDSWVNMGISYKNIEQYGKAVECCQSALRVKPGESTAIFNWGMIIMGELQSMNKEVFISVRRDKAERAAELFKQLIGGAGETGMVKLQLLRARRMSQEGQGEKGKEALREIVKQLEKQLASSGELESQITLQLGYILNLLKDYEASATRYRQSMTGFHKRRRSSVKEQLDVNKYDVSEGIKEGGITEEEGMKMIEKGEFSRLRGRLQSMPEGNIVRGVVELALEVEMAQETGDIEKAKDVYQRFFMWNGVEYPFENMTNEAHKALGSYLMLLGKFQESIKHFEHVSTSPKDNKDKGRIHAALGGDYEALGDKQRALREYRTAMSADPSNHELVFNLATALSDSGEIEEAMRLYSQFLEIVQASDKISKIDKELFKADCLITIASCGGGGPQEYDRYERAYSALVEIWSYGANKIQEEKLLSFVLRWVEMLELQLGAVKDVKSERYLLHKQALIDGYTTLLELHNCPDRDAILNNCATLYSESGMFLNALAVLNQISTSSALSLNNLALVYFNLGQHYLASRTMMEAVDEGEDFLVRVNKELMQWVYKIGGQGILAQKMTNANDDVVAWRWQYAVMVVGVVSDRVRVAEMEDKDEETVQEDINRAVYGEELESFLGWGDKIKAQALKAVINKYSTPHLDDIEGEIINLCLHENQDTEQAFRKLLGLLERPDSSITKMRVSIFLFAYLRKGKCHLIKDVMQQKYPLTRTDISIEQLGKRRSRLSKIVQTRSFSCKTFDEVISQFCSWECELQNKLVQLTQVIEKVFYECKWREPMERQHHFPRHNQLSDRGTLSKLITILTNAFRLQGRMITESNLTGAKNQLLKGLEEDLGARAVETEVTLGSKFVPLTLFAAFLNKQACLKFIEGLGCQIEPVTESCRELVILVQCLVRVRCSWDEESRVSQVVRGILQNPLPLDEQALFGLDAELADLRDASPQLNMALSVYAQLDQ